MAYDIHNVPADQETYAVNRHVSVIVGQDDEGDWEPDGYIWLPDRVSYELDEAGALYYIETITDLPYLPRWPVHDNGSVTVYRLAAR